MFVLRKISKWHKEIEGFIKINTPTLAPNPEFSSYLQKGEEQIDEIFY